MLVGHSARALGTDPPLESTELSRSEFARRESGGLAEVVGAGRTLLEALVVPGGMSAESDNATAFGIGGASGWLVGGAVGGAVGAAAFGVLMWLLDPAVVEVAIPSIYGLEPVGFVGWGIHVAHGIGLGLVFGLLVTRDPILGILLTDVETEAVSGIGAMARIVGAGFVFGLAVFAILPLLVLPVWAEAGAAGGDVGDFPTAAIETLLGHLVFGTVLGIVFAVTVDLHGRTADRPLED